MLDVWKMKRIILVLEYVEREKGKGEGVGR